MDLPKFVPWTNYEYLLIKIVSITFKPIMETKTKPTETKELNFTKPMKTFSINTPTESQETKWMPRLNISEVFSYVSNILEKYDVRRSTYR